MDILVVLFLFLCPLVVYSSSPSLNRRYQALSFPEPKRLSAATLSSELRTRGNSPIMLAKREASFEYLLPDDTHGQSVFATTLNVQSEWPILGLEDFEASIDHVSCTDSDIQLIFGPNNAEEAFGRAIKDMSEFVIVTSHVGCDLEGERSAHRVTAVTVDFEHHIFTLNKVRMDWHDAFSSTKVSFSRRNPAEIQRREAVLDKRQQLPTHTFPAAPSEASGLSTATSVPFDVHHENLEIYPLDIPGADQVLPQVPVAVRCKNCSFQGEIELSRGEFSIEEDFINRFEEAIDFFRYGSVELLLKQLFSQVELELELSLEDPLVSQTMALPTIGLTPFQIAGVVTFGPQILPEFVITVDVEGDIGLSYGFNVTVPDNSRVIINMTALEDSNIYGFENTEIQVLPFEASTEVTSMELNIAFRPQILLGISTGVDALNVDVEGGIGAFLSLPNLSLNVTQVTGVNERCEEVAETEGVVGNATHLVPSVDLDIGVLAGYEVHVMDFNQSAEVDTVLASTSWPLATWCVLFHPRNQATSTARPSVSKADTERNGSNGDDSSDDSNNAASLRGMGGTALLCATVLSLIAAGFCGCG